MLAPADLWDDGADGAEPSRQLMHRAKLLGDDIRVLNPGGGNFSVKGEIVDHLGRPTEVMWISGWGCDGALLTDGDLACLRVEDVRAARDDDDLCDDSMFGYLAHCATTNGQPHPAIETLLHAYLPARHVDHTHPEAVIALTAVDDGRALADKTFGDEAIWIDYEQFGPAFARRLAAEIESRPQARFVLLANHGMLTWGDSSEECYHNTIEAATRAAQALDDARTRPLDLGGEAVPPLSDADAAGYLLDVLPTVRGRLSTGGTRMVLQVDADETARPFTCSRRGPELSLVGPACPDSLVKMKRLPAVVEVGVTGDADERRAGVTSAIAAYCDDYLAYWRRNAPEEEPQPPAGADLPRVFVIRGVGVVSAGEDAFAASLAEAHYRQTRRVVTVADAVGGYSSLTEAQAWADEYWPLLRNKPQLRPPRGDLAGHVVLVAVDEASGAVPADGIVQRLAHSLLVADAHVVLARSTDTTADLAQALRDSGVSDEVVSTRLAECAAADPVRGAVLAFGGLDFVVHLQASAEAAADLAVAASHVFRRQGWWGHYVATAESRESGAAVLRAVRAAAPQSVTPHVVTLDPGVAWAERKASALRSVIALARAGLSADAVLTPVAELDGAREATA